ncbi:unnamed protein product, partial [Effrenium voratum]
LRTQQADLWIHVPIALRMFPPAALWFNSLAVSPTAGGMRIESAGCQTFPVKVLLGRLEAAGAAPWSSFLPDHLRPKGVSAEIFKEKKLVAKVKPKADYTPVGISVVGRVWEYSQDSVGCREVQDAMDKCDEATLVRMATELKDHVWDAACCPHANHVLQKCILALRPGKLQFIIDVFVHQRLVVQAARHKYGCRIIQRLIERCPSEQIEGLLRCLMKEAPLVSCHAYGNYV